MLSDELAAADRKRVCKVSTRKECVRSMVETNSFGHRTVYSTGSDGLEKYQGKIHQLALRLIKYAV